MSFSPHSSLVDAVGLRAAGMTCLQERKTATYGFNVGQAWSGDLRAAWRPWKHTSGWKAAQTHIPAASWASHLKYAVRFDCGAHLQEAKKYQATLSGCSNAFNMLSLPLCTQISSARLTRQYSEGRNLGDHEIAFKSLFNCMKTYLDTKYKTHNVQMHQNKIQL